MAHIVPEEVVHAEPPPGCGCCIAGFGKFPKPIDTLRIEKDGGKFVRLTDGRIIEYFVYGSTKPDAKTLVQFTGTAGTARFFCSSVKYTTKLKELNIRGIGITVPGHGYSSTKVGRLIYDINEDIKPIFEAENVDTFIVEGTSYGSSHALALAHYFGKAGKVEAMHLHVPYVSKAVAVAEGLSNDGTSSTLQVSTANLQTCSSCHYFCCASCAFKCMNWCLSSTYDDPDLPESGALQAEDLKRCAAHSSYGIIMNAASDHAAEGWGFDPREVKEWVSGANKVLVSYAKDDNDAPPEHGEFLGRYFEATVNAEDIGRKHDTYMARFLKGELLEQLVGLMQGA
jgi:pimeloyl-ACP methyl ester carboxylesterase